MKTIGVKLPGAPASSYDVLLAPGLLADAPRLLAQHAPADRYAVISDAHVAPLYGEPLRRALAAAGLPAELLVHPAGEGSKTRASWSALTDALLTGGFGRDTCVVALGGGVTGDLAGFVAATYLRGVPVVQVPTSLLAMVDASVGGKTAVDTDHGKNLVGAFHPPRVVLVDPLVLRTLPPVELRSGAAEMVKHAAIADVRYLDRIRAAAGDLAGAAFGADASRAAALSDLIARSIEIKAGVVGRDPVEQGERAVLNFGHTLGHALERVLAYGIPHGHAVAIGMVLAARLGEAVGMTAAGTAGTLADALHTVGLPVRLPEDVAWTRLLEAAATDKKARAGRLRFVLLERVGAVAREGERWTHEIDESALSAALAVV